MPEPPTSSFAKQRKPAASEPRHGSSLPLLAFAGAKKTTYDPRVAKKKASNLAAKRVNEFRKLKAKLEAQGKLSVPSAVVKAREGAVVAADGRGSGGERIAAKNEREKEEANRARAAALEAAEQRRRQHAAAEARRKEKTALLRKKTHRGQPVMKYRMEGILSKLAAESAMGGGGGRR